MQLRSFKSSLLGACCLGCSGKQLTGVGCAARSQFGGGSQPGPGTGAWTACGLRVSVPGVGRLGVLCFFPSLSPRAVSCGIQRRSPWASVPSRVFPSWAPGFGTGEGTRWHVRCPVRDQPGERSGFPVICHHRAQQVSAWHAQIAENTVVTTGCNVSSGTSGAAATFYLGRAGGAASPRHRG